MCNPSSREETQSHWLIFFFLRSHLISFLSIKKNIDLRVFIQTGSLVGFFSVFWFVLHVAHLPTAVKNHKRSFVQTAFSVCCIDFMLRLLRLSEDATSSSPFFFFLNILLRDLLFQNIYRFLFSLRHPPFMRLVCLYFWTPPLSLCSVFFSQTSIFYQLWS